MSARGQGRRPREPCAPLRLGTLLGYQFDTGALQDAMRLAAAALGVV